MKNSFLTELRELSYSKNSTYHFNARTKDNLSLVQRLKLVDCHRVHRGCVNTIAWDEAGNYILSGSDDLRLVVLDPFSGKIALTHKTKHPTNIFCAKFLPQTQNEQVVSSSAAGHIFHTYLDREDNSISLGFNCHTGAAYELATIPNDPFVFMSCGEDRTVRWFDLRIKSSCNKEDCSEDVLVNCTKPVMSMSLHPNRPFEFAAGCSDSSVRIYDRRFIVPYDSGRPLKEACLMQFACPLLDNHHRRITSLLYSTDGNEILVSYSSEHLYLFDFKKDGRKFKSLLKTPLRHESAPSDPSLMFSLNNDIKTSTSPPSSPQSSSSSSSSSPMELTQSKGKVVKGIPFIAGISKQLPIKRLRLRGDWSDTGPQARPKKERSTGEQSSGVTSVMERMSNLMTQWLERNLDPDNNNNDGDGGDVASGSNDAEDRKDDGNEDNNKDKDDGDDDDDDDEITKDDTEYAAVISSSGKEDVGCRMEGNDSSPDRNCKSKSRTIEVEEEPIVRVERRRRNNLNFVNELGQSSRSHDCDPHENVASSVNSNDLKTFGAGYLFCEKDGIAVKSRTQDADVSWQQQNVADVVGPSRPKIFISLAPSNNSQPQSQSTDSIRDRAAKTIQTFFSNRLKGASKNDKAEKTDNDGDDKSDDDDFQGLDESSFKPAMTKCYKGHRNSRTLIKEASFWGSKYVMSGSDCGHIFVWDKETTELVMFLEGDNHVVNCLQPHPSLPVLASSGIDYDVKIWLPASDCHAFNQAEAYQVMNRNEVMLEETKGTVTVPAEFMFRLFSSLNRIRRGQREGYDDL